VVKAEERAKDGSVRIVASVCALYHDASEEDVLQMVEKTSNMIGDLLKKSDGSRTRSRPEHLAGIDTGAYYGVGVFLRKILMV
jgi:hypothetical protein